MTPETFIRYARTLYDQYVLNQALAGLLNSFKKPAVTPQPPRATGQVVRPKTPEPTAIPSTALAKAVTDLKQLMQPLFSASEEELEVLRGFGIAQYAEPSYYSTLARKVQATPAEAEAEWYKAARDLGQFVTKLTQLFSVLSPFQFTSITIPNGMGDLEVIFEGRAAIDDITGAKHWFEKWYLIIEGYAQFLNKHKEDFVFVQITKASPTRLRIRATANDIATIATILSLLLQLEQRYAERRMVIENMKQTRLVDPEEDAAYVSKSEAKLNGEIESELQKLAEDQLKTVSPKLNSGANFFVRSIEEQHNFIINGGQVNIFLAPTATVEQKELLMRLEEEKARLSNIEARIELLQGKERRQIK